MTYLHRSLLFLMSLLATATLTAGPAPSTSGLLWVDATGRPDHRARQALQILDEAAADGLDPADYGSVQLHQFAAALEVARPPAGEAASRFDIALTAAMERYLTHLRDGRIDPRSLGMQLPPRTNRDDVATLLREGVERDRLAELVERMRPPFAEYRALREALPRYRALVTAGTGGDLPPVTKSIHPGETYAGTRLLRARLASFGDLPASAVRNADDAAYDVTLAEGVKRFQGRHGLDADGVLGRTTWSALSVPTAQRVRQIEFAMERLRWLPDLSDRRLIMLNIPMFQIRAWDRGLSGAPSITMKAIVGRAGHTQTPVFGRVMEAVIFRPYWNIPSSILRNEILPVMRKDPDYLRREDMEIVRGGGDDAAPVEATPEQIGLLEQGALRLRQRPGPMNALGLVKFVFPNEEHVYLHGTPAQYLFARARRDFSHGCVRVENPVGLAEWVFKGESEWDRERILAAMSDEDNVSRQVRLKQPVQVILFYTTATVATEDGAIHFAADIYKRDAALDAALRRGRR